jgi:putative Mn2+ efflux pump MntP
MDRGEPQTSGAEWEGFRRRRWANVYALLFTLLFGTSTALFFSGIDIGRYGRGYQVANLVIGIFELVAIVAGMFLGRLLAWRLGENARRVVMIMTVACGLAALAGAWMIYRAS